jgi:sulfur-oxidizing protein SoxZ
MSNYGYVRLRAPREAKQGEVIRVKALVTHPMEGIVRDKQGNVVQKNYHMVYKVTGYYDDKVVATITPTQSVSANPFFSFKLRVQQSGTVKIVFEDTFGKQYEATKKVNVS